MTDPTLFDDPTGGGRRRATVSGGEHSSAAHGRSTPGVGTGSGGAARRHPVQPGETPATLSADAGRDGDVRRRPVRSGEISVPPHDRAERDAVGRVAGQVEALLAGLRSLGGELLEERLGLVGR